MGAGVGERQKKPHRYGPNTSGLSPHGNMNFGSIPHLVPDDSLYPWSYFFSYISYHFLATIGHKAKLYHVEFFTYFFLSWADILIFFVDVGWAREMARTESESWVTIFTWWILAPMWLLFFLSIARDTHDLFVRAVSEEIYG